MRSHQSWHVFGTSLCVLFVCTTLPGPAIADDVPAQASSATFRASRGPDRDTQIVRRADATFRERALAVAAGTRLADSVAADHRPRSKVNVAAVTATRTDSFRAAKTPVKRRTLTLSGAPAADSLRRSSDQRPTPLSPSQTAVRAGSDTRVNRTAHPKRHVVEP